MCLLTCPSNVANRFNNFVYRSEEEIIEEELPKKQRGPKSSQQPETQKRRGLVDQQEDQFVVEDEDLFADQDQATEANLDGNLICILSILL